jgi:hypothetical protein
MSISESWELTSQRRATCVSHSARGVPYHGGLIRKEASISGAPHFCGVGVHGEGVARAYGNKGVAIFVTTGKGGINQTTVLKFN